jgi:hypothetical protein
MMLYQRIRIPIAIFLSDLFIGPLDGAMLEFFE